MVFLLLNVIFVMWLVATAINQFEWKFWLKVHALDCFGLLPRWTFFAPRPGTNDVRIVYRDICENGTLSSWLELPTMPCRRALVRMFWNPEKLDNKAVFDLAQVLGTEAAAFKSFPKASLASFPYIQLLEPVMTRPRSEGAIARQFALITSRGHIPPRETVVIMLSQQHPFDRV
jgi:hypothetical protein